MALGVGSLLALLTVLGAAGLAILGNEMYYNPDAGKVPTEMWALQSSEAGKISLDRVPVPKPGKGEILVKVHYSPVNPSDIYNAMGTSDYAPSRGQFPHLNGLEGSGVVVASGGGPLGYIYSKLQLRVAAVSNNLNGQFWSEYAVTTPAYALPLPGEVDLKQGASTFVNPLTVLGMLEIANEGGHKGLLHTAASSSLGLQLLRAAPRYGTTILCVVRGEKNVKALKEVGHPDDLIIRSDVDTFEDDLKKAIAKYEVTLAFDAIGGSFSRKIYDLMPSKSIVYQYGKLSGEKLDAEFIESKKNDKDKPFSFWLVGPWIMEGGGFRMAKIAFNLYRMLPNELATTFDRELKMSDENIIDILYKYAEHQKGGKMVINTIMD